MKKTMQALGRDACPAYRTAWLTAYREKFAPVRSAYYAAVRKVIPQSEYTRPGISALDTELLTKYQAPFKAEIKANGGEDAMRELGKSMMLNLMAAAEAKGSAGQPPLSDAEVDAIIQKPGGLCWLDPASIERDAHELP